MRFGIVNKETNKVVNVIIWEGAEFLPPRGHYVVRDDNVDIDDIYDPATNTFTEWQAIDAQKAKVSS